ncbi:MAG: PDZ domain-containing protein [Planctomycetes bacterium]|nr:PDZ domain-containing protein [Planctomycetota bacterium]
MNPNTEYQSHPIYRTVRQASLCLAGLVCVWTASCGGSAGNSSGVANGSGEDRGGASGASGQGQVAGASLRAVLDAKKRYDEHSKANPAPLTEEWKLWQQRQEELSKELSAVAEREYPEIYAAIRGHQKATTVSKDRVAAEMLHLPFRMPIKVIDVEPAKSWAKQAMFGGADMKYMLRFSLVGKSDAIGPMLLLYCAVPEKFATALKKDEIIELRATLRAIESEITYQFAFETPEAFPVRQQIAAIRKQLRETDDSRKAALLVRDAGGLGPFAAFDACLLWEAYLIQRVGLVLDDNLTTEEAQPLARQLIDIDIPLMTARSFEFQQMAIVSDEFGPLLLMCVLSAMAEGKFDQAKAEDLGHALGGLLARSETVYRDRARRHDDTKYGLFGAVLIPESANYSRDAVLQTAIISALAKLRSAKAVRGLQEFIGARWPMETLRLQAALVLAVTPGNEAAQALQDLGDLQPVALARRVQSLKTKFPRCLFVFQLDRGSLAETAGLKVGDVVLRYDGQAVDTTTAYGEAREAAENAGKKQVALVVWRNGEEKSLTVPVGKLGFNVFDVEFPKENK